MRKGNGFQFHTKIRGGSHANPDGTNRQRLISSCRAGQRLLLVPEPNNPVDPLAVAVYAPARRPRQIGYLSADIAAEFAAKSIEVSEVVATVTAITGGSEKHYGMNILLSWSPSQPRPPGQRRGCLGALARLFMIAILIIIVIALAIVYAAHSGF